MRKTALLAITLIIIGISSAIYQGFTHVKKEDSVKIGSMTETTDVPRTIPLSSIAGAVALVAGILLLAKKQPENRCG